MKANSYTAIADKGSGIVNDPNRADALQYLLRPIGKVIGVSQETVEIVAALPELGLDESVSGGKDES